jgi:hypothetical protein
MYIRPASMATISTGKAGQDGHVPREFLDKMVRIDSLDVVARPASERGPKAGV